jgi:hypothetical protein
LGDTALDVGADREMAFGGGGIMEDMEDMEESERLPLTTVEAAEAACCDLLLRLELGFECIRE